MRKIALEWICFLARTSYSWSQICSIRWCMELSWTYQTNTSKYFINYISDESEGVVDDETNHHEQEHNDNHDFDVSSLPNSLIITPVPQDLFTNQGLKVSLVIDSKIRLFSLSIGRVRAIISRLWFGYNCAVFEIFSTCTYYIHFTL